MKINNYYLSDSYPMIKIQNDSSGEYQLIGIKNDSSGDYQQGMNVDNNSSALEEQQYFNNYID